jgi:arylsulfatase A-like enzyme
VDAPTPAGEGGAGAPFVLPSDPGGAAAQAAGEGAAASEKLRYERELRYLDDVLADFVGKLDDASPPQRTLLVVTSGHGEEFLEHGAREHGTHLYDESIRVPLLLRGAGVRDERRYDEVVGLIDIAPTILDIAGFDAAAAMQGVSIAEEIRKGRELPTSPRISEAHSVSRKLAAGEDVGWKPPAFAISDDSHKLIAYVVEERRVFEVYDVESDPAERADLLQGSTAPPWALELRNALDRYTGECKAVAHAPARTETLPVSTLFKLKAFGYL